MMLSKKLPKLSKLRIPSKKKLITLKNNLQQKVKSLRTHRTYAIICGLVFIITAIILIAPSIPGILFNLNPPDPEKEPDYPVTVVQIEDGGEMKEEKKYITDGNRLYIPKIGVDTEILENSVEDILWREEGVWRDPATAKPGGPGNMVIAGHRYQYLPPNTTTLYNLDKVAIGDKLNVYWEGKEIIYQIFEIFEVNPSDIWIKSQDTQESIITIYTCTPIYTSEKRLVVKARQVI